MTSRIGKAYLMIPELTGLRSATVLIFGVTVGSPSDGDGEDDGVYKRQALRCHVHAGLHFCVSPA